MNQKSKLLFGFIIIGLLVGGCTSDVNETNEGVGDTSTETLNSDLGDLDQLDQELNELNELALDGLDF
jgi:hypothetical protein